MGYARKRVTEELYAAAGKLLDPETENGFKQWPWRRLDGPAGFRCSNLWSIFCSERSRLRKMKDIPEKDQIAFLQLAQAVDEEYNKWIEDGKSSFVLEINQQGFDDEKSLSE